MKSKVEAIQDNELEITIEIPAADVDAQIRRTYADFAKRYKFPGFRPGKAPRKVIDSMLGEGAVLTDVTETLVNTAYPEALDEHDIVPLARPTFDDPDVVEGQDLKFTAKVIVAPKVELTNYDAVAIEMPAAEATEAEIAAGIEEFRGYYTEYKDAPANTKVKKDQYVDLTITCTDPEGNKVDALSCEDRLYQLGQNLYPAAFDAELIGMKKGEEKSFDLELNGDTPSIITSGLDLPEGLYHYDVKVNSIKKTILPEVDDEFAKRLGFDDLAALRELVSQQITSQKEMGAERRKENECLQAVAARVEGELPAAMCEQEETQLLQNLFRQLNQSGMTYDAFLKQSGLTPDQLKEDVKKQAADTVRQNLALDAWARHFDIQPTEEDITDEFVKAGVDDPVVVEAQWKAEGRIPLVREGIRRAKALDDLMENAQVTIIEESLVGDNETKEESK